MDFGHATILTSSTTNPTNPDNDDTKDDDTKDDDFTEFDDNTLVITSSNTAVVELYNKILEIKSIYIPESRR